MFTRREWLEITTGAGASLALAGRLNAQTLSLLQNAQNGLIMRAIPSTGEMIPALGLGSAYSFSAVARTEDLSALKEVIKTLVERGARVLDTAPGYGVSEEAAGKLAGELGVTNKIFWATKVNAAMGRGGGGGADLAVRARAQIEDSFVKLKVPKVDVIQVHNLSEVPTQLGVLKEFKQAGRVRYIGVTTTSENQYPQLQQIMNSEPIDFIGVDYAVDNREIETTILPLAQQKKIGVLVYYPFGRTRLWQRVEAAKLATPPDWAKEFGATTWAQFFIKYVLAHPGVTAVTPGTSNAAHMIDNLGGGIGRLPDEATRVKMRELVDALPQAPGGGRGL